MSSYKLTTLTVLPIPVHLLAEGQPLPFVFDDFSLALRLGVRCKTLWYCIRCKEKLYSKFTIPKANGTRRPIHHPRRVLKWVQKRIASVILKPLPVLDCVGAYVPGRGCRDSAEQHTQKGVLVKIDLANFFPSHTRARVRNFFHDLGYSHWVSGLLGDLTTVVDAGRHFVPQGSPASPMLCNHIAQRYFDVPLLRALQGTGWTYTRYSDDLTFSHPADQSTAEIEQLIALVRQHAYDARYRINWSKLRVQRRTTRQQVLGMVVNVHPNIPRDVYKRYRAIITNCFNYGFLPNALWYGGDFIEAPQAFASHLHGKVSYFKSINPNKGEKLTLLLREAIEKHRDETFDIP